MKATKYFAAFMMVFCTFFLVYDWFMGLYVGAMIQAVCLYINHCTYSNAVEREKEQAQQTKKDDLK